MLPSSRITLVEARGPLERLQASLEALVGLFLEGRLQASLLVGEPEGEGVLLGYYQASPLDADPGTTWRRITGGPEARVGSGSWYIGLVFASEDLAEAVGVARGLAECLGGGVWGATRMGPRELGAGIVEVVTSDASRALECARGLVARPGASASRLGVPESASRIERAYRDPRWKLYTGASPLPLRASVSRGPYSVRVGVSLYEGRYVSLARLDGVFMAAPPNEPFNTAAALQGMPVGDQLYTLVEARLGGAELYGIAPGDVVEALREALEAGGSS